MLLPPASDIHFYEPNAQNILSIKDCDVFIYGGGESDVWVDGILASIDRTGMLTVRMTGRVYQARAGDCGRGCHEAGGIDEHIWTSPLNAILIAGEIAGALSEADPKNAGFYRQNAAALIKELEGLDRLFREIADGGTRNTIVFGSHFPFLHLATDYGLSYYAAFPGCSSQTEADARTIASLISLVKDEGIPVVFYIELSCRKMAEAIAGPSGAKVLPLHACHTVPRDDFQNGVTYLELMRRNAEALKQALS
jgi:zinc transport system substrate-binding protein